MGEREQGTRGRGSSVGRLARPFTDLIARLRGGGAEPLDRDRLAAVLELNRVLVEAVDNRRALLVGLVDEAVRAFAAERGFLIRAQGQDGAPRSWQVELGRSLDREPILKPDRKISRTVVQRCLDERRGVFVEDAQVAGGELSGARSIADMQLRSVLCMPLIAPAEGSDGRCLGAVYLDHRFRRGAFREEDLPWFQVFTDQAWIALHLAERLEQQAARTREAERRGDRLAAEVARAEEELGQVRDRLARTNLRGGGAGYEAFVGESPALLKCLHLIDRVAADGSFPVLLVGESGTGKELAARALHANGPRRAAPFVAVNVAAVQPDLLESELFGHVRGAFTGADRDRKGLVREADGGVLFLDEFTECDPELQAKLLRLLENGEVRAVGGDRTGTVDLRVVAATNRDPLTAIAEGRLREDLYYRLAVVTVRMPPLRERLGDLSDLVRAFFVDAARARGVPAERAATASPELLRALRARPWPGNLRELRNEITRLDALSAGLDGPLGPELLAVGTSEAQPAADAGLPTLDLAVLERLAIQSALAASAGNKSEAARLLGLSRRALYNKIERLGLGGG